MTGHDCASHARNVYAEIAADIKQNGYKLPELPPQENQEQPSQPAPLKV